MRSRSIAQSLSTTMLLIFGLSLFSFAPISQAANSLILNVNIGLDPFHINVPNQSAVVYISYDYNTGGYSTGAVTEQILDADNNVVYEFGNTGPDNLATNSYQLVWDGTYKNGGGNDGAYVPNGTYSLYIYSDTPTPPPAEHKESFVVENTVIPEISLVNEPSSAYYTQSGNYDINYTLGLNSASTSIVRLTINGPLNNNPQQEVKAEVKGADGNYVISWDGKIQNNTAAPGQYSYKLQAEGSVDGFGVMSNELTGEFTVSNQQNPQPTLTGLSASPDPYDPSGGLVTLTYVLENSLGNTKISAQVYSSSDPNTSLHEWEFSGQGNGSNSVSWDGTDINQQTVSNGSYIFKVWGSDGNYSIVSQQKSFAVAKVDTIPSPSNTCGGYSDVPKNDSDCAAIEYVQSLGAMTGNPNGTFAPDEILQRDQVAKISLETFNLFSAASDYCGGTPSFPDVTSSAWSYQYICRGVDLGMITGYEAGADAGYYRPARSVNRVEFLALILRNLNDTMPSNSSVSYNDVSSGEWYSGYAKYSYDNSLFVGNSLSPTQFVSRREVAETLYKLHNLGKI